MSTHQVAVLLLDLAVIVVVTRTFGALATRLRQPAVIGEVFGAVLLGPTLVPAVVLGTLFPADVRPYLSALANLGVALFMFVVGLELDQGLVSGKLRVALCVSAGSIILPLGMGMLLAVYLFQYHPAGDRLGFVLFMGSAMAVTAFPVLARILTDRGLHRSAVGGLALASAAVGDVLAWSLLAIVVAMVSGAVQWQLLLIVPYLLVMFLFVRPMLRRRLGGEHGSPRGTFAVVLVGLLVSGALTEWFGLHFIFGAFLFGVVMPRDTMVRETVLAPVEQISMTLLLPVYFVMAGLKVDLSGIDVTGLGELGLILLVAVSSKFLGAYAGARLQGVPPRSSAALGTLMNTRGLTELVILTVGLQLGVLDTRLYSLMVVMALVTTAMAGPLLHFLNPTEAPTERLARPPSAAAPAAP